MTVFIMQIWQNEVDNVDGSDRSVLSRCTIELILFAVNTRDPVMLDYRMELHGTKPLRDYNIVFDPFDSKFLFFNACLLETRT